MPIRNRKRSLSSLLVFLAGLVLFSAFAYYYAHVERSTPIYVKDQTLVDTTGELTGEMIAEQSFTVPYNGLAALTILVGTYDRSNSALYTIRLFDAGGRQLFQGALAGSDFTDNEEQTIPIDPIEDSKDKIYRLQITSADAKPGNAIAIYTYPAADPASHLMINGQDTGKTLAVKSICRFFDIQTVIILVYFGLVVFAFLTYIYKYI